MAYAYQIEDKSITVPVLKKYLWAPSMALVSQRRSANTLTLAGNACSALAFVLLAVYRPLGAPDELFLLPAVLLFAFLTLDNLDGMQARRTGRCSPYGEFLDHWGDTFNMGSISLGFGLSMELPPWMILTTLGLCQLTNFSQFWEQRLTGWLRFGPVGGTEGVLLVSLLYVAVAALGWETVARTPLWGPVTFAHVFWGTACAGFVHAGSSCLWRVRREPSAFTTLTLVVLLAAAWHAWGGLGVFPAAFTMALAGSLFTGRQITHRILERPFPAFEWPLLWLVAAGFAVSLSQGGGAENAVVAVASWLPVGYLSLRLAGDFLGMTYHLAEHVQPDELVSIFLLPRRLFGPRRG